jgi:hypothetical protein
LHVVRRAENTVISRESDISAGNPL